MRGPFGWSRARTPGRHDPSYPVDFCVLFIGALRGLRLSGRAAAESQQQKMQHPTAGRISPSDPIEPSPLSGATQTEGTPRTLQDSAPSDSFKNLGGRCSGGGAREVLPALPLKKTIISTCGGVKGYHRRYALCSTVVSRSFR